MAYTLEDVIGSVRAARAFFLKHLVGLREDQWEWKPYPECKSIRETLEHLVSNDRLAYYTLENGREPEDYNAFFAASEADLPGLNREQLLTLVGEGRERVFTLITTRYSGQSLDAEAYMWGMRDKLGSVVAHLASEDFYHAGQVAFIRQATDPEWNYYKAIYGYDV